MCKKLLKGLGWLKLYWRLLFGGGLCVLAGLLLGCWFGELAAEVAWESLLTVVCGE